MTPNKSKKVMKTPVGISSEDMKRIKKRPYYAFLYARNILQSRLPEKVEMILAGDSQSSYLYAKHVIKGKLPDHLHNALLITSFAQKSDEWIQKYLEEFCSEPKKSKKKKATTTK